jgi:hypothetical protein
VLFFVTVRAWPAPPAAPRHQRLSFRTRTPWRAGRMRARSASEHAAAPAQAVFGEFYLARRMHSSLTSLLSAFVFLVVDSLLSYWVTLLFTEVRSRHRRRRCRDLMAGLGLWHNPTRCIHFLAPRQPALRTQAVCACMLARACTPSAVAPQWRGGMRPPCAPAQRARPPRQGCVAEAPGRVRRC